MTSQRAGYLRRAIPLLGVQRCPRHRRTVLLTDRCEVTSYADLARQVRKYIDGRTYCPRCAR